MLNFEGEGKLLCRIVSDSKEKGKKKIYKIIYVTDDEKNVMACYNEIKYKDNEHIQFIPNFMSERDCLYICGKSGSGKSYWMTHYMKQYNIVYPERQIYVFSPVSDDPTIKGVKNIHFINIYDDAFLQTELIAEDFKNSLVCFDDCDCIKDKFLHRKIDSILTMLLQVGRHYNISVCYLSHQACKGHETKAILNETHGITFFKKGLGGKSLKYLLENYLSLDKKQIEQVNKIKSRHITITNSYPTCVIYDKGVYVFD